MEYHIIQNKKELKEWIRYEKNRYDLKFKSLLNPISERNLLFRLQKRLRKTEYYKNNNKNIKFKISYYLLRKIEIRYGINIPINTCGKGLKILHIGPILINGSARIGENCSLHINTAIVAGGTNDIAPKLGNNIVLGIGSVVLGDVSLADYIAVGANAVVNKSFEEQNISIAGVPAKKISDTGSIKWNKDN